MPVNFLLLLSVSNPALLPSLTYPTFLLLCYSPCSAIVLALSLAFYAMFLLSFALPLPDSKFPK